MSEKKQDVVVTDRRRFAPEGELRPDVPVIEEEKTPPAPAAAPLTPPPAEQAQTTPQTAQEQLAASDQPDQEEMPPPPTAVEQQERTEAYRAARNKLDDLVGPNPVARPNRQEMSVQRLVESF